VNLYSAYRFKKNL